MVQHIYNIHTTRFLATKTKLLDHIKTITNTVHTHAYRHNSIKKHFKKSIKYFILITLERWWRSWWWFSMRWCEVNMCWQIKGIFTYHYISIYIYENIKQRIGVMEVPEGDMMWWLWYNDDFDDDDEWIKIIFVKCEIIRIEGGTICVHKLKNIFPHQIHRYIYVDAFDAT